MPTGDPPNVPLLDWRFRQNALPTDEDTIEDLIDVLADLGTHWKRHRSLGRTPQSIRAAMLDLCKDITTLGKESEHG
jgi:hypothetical protein